MRKIRAAKEKAARNAEYAERFPPVDRDARRRARNERVRLRDAAWCSRNL